MVDESDAFITLPGGISTLEEIFQITSWTQLNIHQKPIGLLNTNGFFNKILSFLDFSMDKGFISPLSRNLLFVTNSPEELLNYFNSYVPKLDSFLQSLDWSSKSDDKKRKLE